jgi:phthalate 4,5-dioxygenase
VVSGDAARGYAKVLSEEDNEILTRVGPGTLMGNLLRRYWMPACLSVEIPEADAAPLRVRLLGEDLVAYRDTDGQVGLLDEHCPHRGASLYFGRNEECGLRCPYHGWKFDTSGQCVDMPSEPRPFADRIQVTAYPTHESGGVVWTYMGPRETMTPFRDFGTDSLPAENMSAFKSLSTCNYVQAMEGNLDSAHISFLHQFNAIDDIPDDGTDRPGYLSNAMSMKIWRHDKAPRFELQEEWYGYRYGALRTTPNGHTHVRINAYVMPFNTLVANVPFNSSQGLFVPIDDTHCWRYFFTTQPRSNPRDLGGAPFFAVPQYPYAPLRLNGASGVTPRRWTAENDYLIDRETQRTSTFSGVNDFASQDLMVTESMGPIYDRSKEHLGTTDVGVIRMRSLLLNAAKALAEGHEPPAVAGDLDYRSIRVGEKILEPGEDWRVIGTDDDPIVREALFDVTSD